MQNVSIDVLEGKLIIMPFAFLINSFSALPDVIHKRERPMTTAAWQKINNFIPMEVENLFVIINLSINLVYYASLFRDSIYSNVDNKEGTSTKIN